MKLLRLPRKTLLRAVGGFVAVFALYFATIGIQQYVFGNIHPVIEGELYRSAQLSPKQLANMSAKYGIRSIINLRGENHGAPWYDDEMAISQMLGVKHYDFRMKASRELSETQALALLALMQQAPKPLLIHCMGGSDRTGLASALYLAGIAKLGEEAAEGQLSLRYGHLSAFPFWWTDSQAMDETFEHLEPMFGFYGS